MNNSIVKLVIPVVLACSCNAIANTFWKWHFMKYPLKIHSIIDVFSLALIPNIIIGILFYVSSMFLFFYMISNFKLSIVIPFTALTYIFNLMVAYLIFHEKIYINNIIGTLIIIIGIVILSKAPSILIE